MYLVDTDVVASYLNGRPDAMTLLGVLLADGLAISAITYGEIFEGIYYGRDPGQNAAVFRRFLHGVNVLEVNRGVARRFARIRGANYAGSGSSLAIPISSSPRRRSIMTLRL